MSEQVYQEPDQGDITLVARVAKIHTVSGKQGAPIRVEILLDDQDNNDKKLQWMRGKAIRIQGPYDIAKDTAPDDQMNLDDGE